MISISGEALVTKLTGVFRMWSAHEIASGCWFTASRALCETKRLLLRMLRIMKLPTDEDDRNLSVYEKFSFNVFESRRRKH